MATQLEHHAGCAQLVGFVNLFAHVRQRDDRTAPHEQLRGRDTTSRRTHDGDASAADGEGCLLAHRSFNVARLNSAKMMAMITNRVMTFGSLHPISSKW